MKVRLTSVMGGDDPGGAEIVLEPMAFPPARTYHEELFKAGVSFSVKPSPAGPTKRAVFNDTCRNNIQLIQII